MKPWTYNSNVSGDWHRCTIMLGDGSTVGGRMSLADARLITAAPELLEALQEALDDWDDTHFDEEYPYRIEWADKARAAIAKAKGEE